LKRGRSTTKQKKATLNNETALSGARGGEGVEKVNPGTFKGAGLGTIKRRVGKSIEKETQNPAISVKKKEGGRYTIGQKKTLRAKKNWGGTVPRKLKLPVQEEVMKLRK